MKSHKYRVKVGYKYGAFDQYGPGSIVVLDDETAKHVLDKLELAEIVIPGSADADNDDINEVESKTETPLVPQQLFTSEENAALKLEPEETVSKSSVRKSIRRTIGD